MTMSNSDGLSRSHSLPILSLLRDARPPMTIHIEPDGTASSPELDKFDHLILSDGGQPSSVLTGDKSNLALVSHLARLSVEPSLFSSDSDDTVSQSAFGNDSTQLQRLIESQVRLAISQTTKDLARTQMVVNKQAEDVQSIQLASVQQADDLRKTRKEHVVSSRRVSALEIKVRALNEYIDLISPYAVDFRIELKIIFEVSLVKFVWNRITIEPPTEAPVDNTKLKRAKSASAKVGPKDKASGVFHTPASSVGELLVQLAQRPSTRLRTLRASSEVILDRLDQVNTVKPLKRMNVHERNGKAHLELDPGQTTGCSIVSGLYQDRRRFEALRSHRRTQTL